MDMPIVFLCIVCSPRVPVQTCFNELTVEFLLPLKLEIMIFRIPKLDIIKVLILLTIYIC